MATVEPAAAAIGADACPETGELLEDAKLYIEHNATDADTGVHGALGGEAWRMLCVFYPDGGEMLVADPLGTFDELAVSDLLFESREPENADVPIDDVRSWFPEGDYLVSSIGYDGVARVSTAWFTHAIPAEPQITSPRLTDEADLASESIVPLDDVVVAWEPVTETIFGDPVTVTGYEVIVTLDDYEDPHGNSRPIYDVHVGADATSLPVPPDFLRRGSVYEVEVLVLEESGNQTIGLGFFQTA